MVENATLGIIVVTVLLLIFASMVILVLVDVRVRSDLFGDKTLISIVLGALTAVTGIRSGL